MQEIKNPFFESALREIPRLLGQIDRNPLSPTYGSCDRAFWQYRTNDISSMRYQESALTLALLYITPFEGNGYYADKQILVWANAAIRFACFNQHSDGSFDEWYLNEGSFVCTAFVSAALAEAALVLGDELEDRSVVLASLEKSGMWLIRHTETLVVNQLAGAISALHAISILTGNVAYKEDAEKKWESLLSLQHSEGWWSEYGGPDAGYLSLAIDYLSRYAERVGDVRVYGAIEKASAFLLHVMNPDGTAGGEYLSRNTEYLIPSGFLRAALHAESAYQVALHIVESHREGRGILPASLDDRYICYILYNWIDAGILWNGLTQRPAPPVSALKNSDTLFFPDAGLLVSGGEAYRIFINARKGGSLRLYTHGSVLIDSGVSVLRDDSVYASNVLRADTNIAYDESRATLRSEGVLIRVHAPLLTTARAILLKASQLVFGRIPLFQRFLKRVLRVVSVMRPGASSNVRYERLVVLKATSVTIVDTVYKPLSRERLVVGEANLYALVPSSRYVVAGTPCRRLQPQSESYESTGGSTRLTRIFTL